MWQLIAWLLTESFGLSLLYICSSQRRNMPVRSRAIAKNVCAHVHLHKCACVDSHMPLSDLRVFV